MFGDRKYRNAKIKKFTSDSARKRYFAIKSYYNKKEKEHSLVVKLTTEKVKGK